MTETILEIRIPSPLLQLGLDREDIQQRVSEWLVISLFAEGHISSGKAARLLGISRGSFLKRLRHWSIPYIDFSEDELAEEIAAAGKLEPGANE